MDAKTIIEIGTYTGLSSAAILSVMNPSRKFVTFDIIPYEAFENGVLTTQDFTDNQFQQMIGDISDFNVLTKYEAIFRAADFIFLDASKDGIFERRVLENFQKLGLRHGTILLFDDIKQWNMLQIWNDILMPKLDITPVGHFTGSGLVEWDSNISCFRSD